MFQYSGNYTCHQYQRLAQRFPSVYQAADQIQCDTGCLISDAFHGMTISCFALDPSPYIRLLCGGQPSVTGHSLRGFCLRR
jgi:hypothetical protein